MTQQGYPLHRIYMMRHVGSMDKAEQRIYYGCSLAYSLLTLVYRPSRYGFENTKKSGRKIRRPTYRLHNRGYVFYTQMGKYVNQRFNNCMLLFIVLYAEFNNEYNLVEERKYTHLHGDAE